MNYRVISVLLFAFFFDALNAMDVGEQPPKNEVPQISMIRVSGEKVSISQSNPKEFSWIDFHIQLEGQEVLPGSFVFERVLSPEDIKDSTVVSLIPMIRLKGLGEYDGIEKLLSMLTTEAKDYLQVEIFNKEITPNDKKIAVKVTQKANTPKKLICRGIVSSYPWLLQEIKHNRLNLDWELELFFDIYFHGQRVAQTNKLPLNWKTNKVNGPKKVESTKTVHKSKKRKIGKKSKSQNNKLKEKDDVGDIELIDDLIERASPEKNQVLETKRRKKRQRTDRND